jgi:hypothetical protein
VVRFDATTFWHIDAAEWAPSTASSAPYHPIQQRVEFVRVGQKVEHNGQGNRDQQNVQSVFSDFPDLGHGAEYAPFGLARKVYG